MIGRARLALAATLLDHGLEGRARIELDRVAAIGERMGRDLDARDLRFFSERPDALQLAVLRARIRPTDDARAPTAAGEKILGNSSAIRRLRQWIHKVAPSQSTVLISGESGVGKELVADALHAASSRRESPFVKVNCAALVDTLLMSELFGHERGAFTGAHARHQGVFESAEGGTLFLDEIGDISPRAQAALLRVLQERTFVRVGSTVSLQANVRVVAATHRDLLAMVREGHFREDLYYRLCCITVRVPSLRERHTDIPLLAHHIAASVDDPALGGKALAPDAIRTLLQHNWPGNIRELQNVLHNALVLADGPIVDAQAIRPLIATGSSSDPGLATAVQAPPPRDLEHLFFETVKHGGSSIYETRRELEKACIRRALAETDGNVTRSAQMLGMTRSRVSQLVKEHGLRENEQ